MNASRRLLTGLGILLLASALSGCSNLEYLNFTVSHRGYVPTRNLAYGPDARQKLDVFVPQSVKPNGKVVVFFYGGGWRTGSKADYRFVAQALTSHGFITVLPDYRLFPQVTFPAFVEDGAAAVRWTRDNIAKFGGDTNQIYLFGHSVGAHTAMLLTLDEHYLKAVGLEPKLIRATIGISGPYDSQPSPRDRPIFGRATNDPTFLPQIEPIKFASSNTPPMLLAHGLSDKIVSPTNTINFVTQLRQRGNDVEYIGYTNCGHGSVIICIAWPNQWIVPVFHDVTDYLDRH